MAVHEVHKKLVREEGTGKEREGKVGDLYRLNYRPIMDQSEVKPKPNAQAMQSNSENAPEYSSRAVFYLGSARLAWARPDR